MKIKKITTGFVIQTFDTKEGKFVSQEFIAGDDVSYETEQGEAVSPDWLNGAYLPFEIFYTETLEDSKQARKREKFLKS